MPDSAFAMEFDQWPPPATAGLSRRAPAPVGAVRLARKGRSVRRQIKVRLDGPPTRRWMNLARFWWIRNRGPVPEGKRVGHFDGDTLNDDPANYALFTPGDVIVSYHLDHPDWSRRQHRRAGRATARSNRERGVAARAGGRWGSTRWYAVDFDRREIHTDPHRERWQVYAAHGAPDAHAKNGRGYAAAALGWPGLTTAGAAILACLADAPGNAVAGSRCLLLLVQSRLRRLRCGAPPRRVGTLHCVMVALKRLGFVAVTRRGRRRRQALYELTPAALAARRPPCAVVAVKGSELGAVEFVTFERVVSGGGAPPAEGQGVAA